MFRFEMILRIALLAPTVLAVVGCGGNPMGGEVFYGGETLVVNGVSYPRRSDAEICPVGFLGGKAVYVAGVVYLYWRDPLLAEDSNQMVQMKTRLIELGLVIRAPFRWGNASVLVPVGWEDQWARALRAQPKVHSGEVDCVYEFENAA